MDDPDPERVAGEEHPTPLDRGMACPGPAPWVGSMNPHGTPDPLRTTSPGEPPTLGSPEPGLVDPDADEYCNLIRLYGWKYGTFSPPGLLCFDGTAGAVVGTDGVTASMGLPPGTVFTTRPTGNGNDRRSAVAA
jgi:hypothetical protein